MMTIVSKLRTAIQTAKQRGAVYGHDGSEVTGRAIAMLFPDGITLKTADDFARFLIFSMMMAKTGRYAKNFAKGGHMDSVHDTGVYAFILEDLDDRCNRKRFKLRANVDDRNSKRRKIRRDDLKGNGRKKKHR